MKAIIASVEIYNNKTMSYLLLWSFDTKVRQWISWCEFCIRCFEQKHKFVWNFVSLARRIQTYNVRRLWLVPSQFVFLCCCLLGTSDIYKHYLVLHYTIFIVQRCNPMLLGIILLIYYICGTYEIIITISCLCTRASICLHIHYIHYMYLKSTYVALGTIRT